MRPRTTSATEQIGQYQQFTEAGSSPTFGMRDVYLVGFSQLWESAKTRFNYSNGFRCGDRRPVFGVWGNHIEKCHLFHLIIVNRV